MPDYIPLTDGSFDAWQNDFVTYATANAAALGLDPLVDIPPLANAQTTWATDFPANVTAQAAAQSTCQRQDGARSTFEGVIRPLVARLQASPDVDAAARRALGITVSDFPPTASTVPTTRPPAPSARSSPCLCGYPRLSPPLCGPIPAFWPLTAVSACPSTSSGAHWKTGGCPGIVPGYANVWSGIAGVGLTTPGLWRGWPSGVSGRPGDFPQFARAHSADFAIGEDRGSFFLGDASWLSTLGETGPWGELISATVVK